MKSVRPSPPISLKHQLSPHAARGCLKPALVLLRDRYVISPPLTPPSYQLLHLTVFKSSEGRAVETMSVIQVGEILNL